MKTAGPEISPHTSARGAMHTVNPVMPEPTQASKQKRLLTLHEAAELLSVSVASVRRLIATDQLRIVRFNRRLLVDLKDLEMLIQQAKRPGF
jgi:excisionase family DNA binding protein